MRQWTPSERQRQAELIKQWQPWKKAGVKTSEGKAVSSQNALKHGLRSAEFNLMRAELKASKKRLESFDS